MNKIFEDEIGCVYNNNYKDIIEELTFDYVFTDPPYNIKYKYLDYNDNMSEEEYIKLFNPLKDKKVIMIHYPESICNVVCKSLGNVNKIISWCYNNHMSSKAHRSIAFWNCNPDFNKVKQPYKNPNDKRIKKLIENGSTGTSSYDWFSNIQQVKNVSKEKHLGFTNQIPIALLERVLLLTTNEGDIILDTFSGSGSLYFACKNTNRKYIGIEQSISHINIFLERLNKIS
jgi:DNA modification methylase